ncbi:hypothetical protein Sfum_2429 [Syntrophobacter fumaroxidans MPOB]|uniref:Uncharacterized protein n=1 Tax=Syntrophobacter fumaroxidans (strain DSM 10017 / MPOB) TaxID=335543 RepID=A0LL07_SYNFM|nr:hypothetical protein Sfum_2429 [Syntrophobacter fumaroxidans MPOB]
MVPAAGTQEFVLGRAAVAGRFPVREVIPGRRRHASPSTVRESAIGCSNGLRNKTAAHLRPDRERLKPAGGSHEENGLHVPCMQTVSGRFLQRAWACRLIGAGNRDDAGYV